MKLTSYQQNLLSDTERLTAFYQIINEKVKGGVVYDLGTGSGVLSSWAAPLARKVYAVEKNPLTAKIAQKNFNSFKNISLIQGDAKNIFFPEKADIIICEMMDTALIDEDQVPALNSIRKYLKPHGDIIPCGVFNGVEALDMDIPYPCYQEGETSNPHVMSKLLIYDKIDFKKHITPEVEYRIKLILSTTGTVSGIRITTFTLLAPNYLCGPTPMFNPPLFWFPLT
ncbi:MAG: hypothetical protein PWQ15_1469 [Methanobacterium sp.]|uniref:methyltransferase domain-containing protein n=1 Tax=Methanobacterium sp. TaxID=2164 RepID=UPI0024AB0267|nr:methyltransferase domain-containing protein [Methanobacterium sp.]MDI3550366.1 hypothetical protein [Methanobacterium sp.]